MNGFELRPLSPQRRLVWDLLRDTDPYYLNHQVFLVDYGAVDALRDRSVAAGLEKPSYVAVTLFALSRVLPRHPAFNAYLREWPVARLALYRGVDIAYTLEKAGADGSHVVSLSVLRDCDALGFRDFLAELERHKAAPLEGLAYHRTRRFFAAVPSFLRVALFRLCCKPFPDLMRNIAGTVAFTSVGKFGVDVTTPLSPKSLTVSLGAVALRPVVRDGAVVAAPAAWLTLTYDHRIADGPDCARLGEDLRDWLQAGVNDVQPSA